jgi:hypothetical protein
MMTTTKEETVWNLIKIKLNFNIYFKK